MVNNVELIGHYGSDEIICLSAWISTSRNLTEEKRERIPQMISSLWKNGHETPFEKGTVHFLIETDIATHIHFLKHRISSLNAESARYKQIKEDRFYIPKDWNIPVSKTIRKNEGNQNLFTEDNIIAYGTDLDTKDMIFHEWWSDVLINYSELGNKLYHQALEELTPILGRKRAKESARYFKTYNSQIQSDVMFNMRSFANFLHLRDSEHAQLEIRELAQKMVKLVQEIAGNPFKETLKAFGYENNDSK